MASTHKDFRVPGRVRPSRQYFTNDDPTVNGFCGVAPNFLQRAPQGLLKTCHSCGDTEHEKRNCPRRVRLFEANVSTYIRTYCAHCDSIRDHNAVTLSPLDLALLDFGAYVRDAVASNAFHFLRIAIVTTCKKHDSFMKVDDFLNVAVTPATRVPLVPRRRIGDELCLPNSTNTPPIKKMGFDDVRGVMTRWADSTADLSGTSVPTRIIPFVPGDTRTTAGIVVAASNEKFALEVIELDEPAAIQSTQSPLPVFPAQRLEQLPALLLQSTGNVAVDLPNLDMTAGTDQGPCLLDFTNVLMPVCYCDHWILLVIHTSPHEPSVTRCFRLCYIGNGTTETHNCSVKDYVQRAMRKASGVEGHCQDANVGVFYANVPRQRPGSLDYGAFFIYCAFKILICGLSGVLGLIGKETLTDVDNGPTMRDPLKEMVKLRSVIAKDGCIEMPKTSSMKILQEQERSRVLEENVPYAELEAETVPETDCREEHEPSTSTFAQTATNEAAWHCRAENVSYADSEAETVPETDGREEHVPSTSVVAQTATKGAACAKTEMTLMLVFPMITTQYVTLPTAATKAVDLITSTIRAVSTCEYHQERNYSDRGRGNWLDQKLAS
ncbi:hypothetical protein DAPPUDRAFT_116465 [Daphnia pulex]|uniref:CCHC-type domain-containing protein n=1 Tax=Daphnia pulex TaxID=6669 RepID=E9HPG9_DAPPU|nr:hypothetical protein DAPPUDRAFT_116465 [Daphnia pulex]|eukprot:EFX66349.1 hypothetical protein DAPPUDRAFT_116465 [Daphnia pulex]